MRNDVVTLVNVKYKQDELKQRIPEETRREVYCTIKSVRASEFFSAGQNSIKPEYQIDLDIDDYEDEKIVELNEKRYGVYRTYKKRDGQIELYLEEKKGI